jgi:hypothetical protein
MQSCRRRIRCAQDTKPHGEPGLVAQAARRRRDGVAAEKKTAHLKQDSEECARLWMQVFHDTL